MVILGRVFVASTLCDAEGIRVDGNFVAINVGYVERWDKGHGDGVSCVYEGYTMLLTQIVVDKLM